MGAGGGATSGRPSCPVSPEVGRGQGSERGGADRVRGPTRWRTVCRAGPPGLPWQRRPLAFLLPAVCEVARCSASFYGLKVSTTGAQKGTCVPQDPSRRGLKSQGAGRGPPAERVESLLSHERGSGPGLPGGAEPRTLRCGAVPGGPGRARRRAPGDPRRPSEWRSGWERGGRGAAPWTQPPRTTSSTATCAWTRPALRTPR